MEKMNTIQPLFPHLPGRLDGLEMLAENLWWSWNPRARMLFKTIDRQAWKESGHNPDKMLRELPREMLEKAAADADYLREYDDVMNMFRSYMQQRNCDWLKSVAIDCKYAVAWVPDAELWQTHYWLKVKLIDAIRERVRQRWANGDASDSIMLTGGAFLDPSILTLGFARRFATYKRALLIFQDVERLKKILKDRWRPIQIIFSGKAHPADDPGKRLLQNLINLARDPQFGGRIAFVEDFGEQMAQYMVHGVDIWLNNPLPPFEACGTSGMKAALNGVPHLSILDGWWVEGFNGKNGWAVEHDGNSTNQDDSDAGKIYSILEDKAIPLYYRMSESGIPHDWVRLMKESMKSAAVQFSARRMIKEYIIKFYSKSMEDDSRD